MPLVNLARKTNEGMVSYIYDEIIKKLSYYKIFKLAFFGISYKENCSQISNSMYLKISNKLAQKYLVDMYDYVVEKSNKKINLINIKTIAK